MAEIVKFKVNGKEIKGVKGASLLKRLLEEGYDIPHLCYHEKLTPYGACRLCIVELLQRGRKTIATSCNYPIMEGIEVYTDTDEVIEERKTVFELLIAQAPESEKLKEYAKNYGVEQTTLKIQEGKCILCGLCERVCNEVIGRSAICFAGRGANKILTTPYEASPEACIGCGACVYLCPTGCLEVIDDEKSMIRQIPYIHFKGELYPCRICGRSVTTKAHIEYLKTRGNFDETTITICEECKKNSYAKLVAFQGHI